MMEKDEEKRADPGGWRMMMLGGDRSHTKMQKTMDGIDNANVVVVVVVVGVVMRRHKWP
jgi:hypothetical protein